MTAPLAPVPTPPPPAVHLVGAQAWPHPPTPSKRMSKGVTRILVIGVVVVIVVAASVLPGVWWQP